MAEVENKLVVRGLPFEATEDQVQEYFGIRKDQLDLPTWSDSGRCKGLAFVQCDDAAGKEKMMTFDGAEFTSGDNTRELSIRQYEERPRGGRRGGPRKDRRDNNRGRRDNRGDRGDRQSAGRGGRGDGANQSYVSDDETSREVYISNVAFSSTKDSFHSFFTDCHGDVESVTIPTHYQSGKPKGFAFVRFDSTQGREDALGMNGKELDGRPLGIRENKGRAERGVREREYPSRREGLSNKPGNCTTIFVGNLPWATDEDALQRLFEDCGDVVNARVVRQSWTQRSRGFGYVEFAAEASVDTAVQKAITVDGRELRLDYADNLVN
jgi:RNA recognition motif-containing protein